MHIEIRSLINMKLIKRKFFDLSRIDLLKIEMLFNLDEKHPYYTAIAVDSNFKRII